MDRVSGAMRNVTTGATAAAATVYGAAPDSVKGVAEQGLQQAQAAASTAQRVGAQGAEMAAHGASVVTSAMQEKMQEYRKLVEYFIKRKIHRYLGVVVDKIPGIVKDATLDPDMPAVVVKGKDAFIDAAWPDFKEEIMYEIAVQLDGRQKKEEDLGPGPDCFRKFFRYHIYPYDKTFWGHLRDPVWVAFTLLSLIPWAGACPLIFLFIFLIIDKTDEFQLIQFILQFKGTQFIAHGIIRTIMGFFLYVNCVTVPAQEGEHVCEESGPGMAAGYEVIVGGYFLQITLVWLAFFLLFCAKDKGRTALGGVIEHQHTGAGGKGGGYLRYLLFYDMFWFLLCCVAMVYVMGTRENKYDDWPVKHAFFACQIVYGFASTPFFIFTLPVLQAVLTHSVPTSYDPEGRCVKTKGPPKPPRKPPQLPQFITMEDARQLSEKAQQIFTQGKTATTLFENWQDTEVEMLQTAEPGGDPKNV